MIAYTQVFVRAKYSDSNGGTFRKLTRRFASGCTGAESIHRKLDARFARQRFPLVYSLTYGIGKPRLQTARTTTGYFPRIPGGLRCREIISHGDISGPC